MRGRAHLILWATLALLLSQSRSFTALDPLATARCRRGIDGTGLSLAARFKKYEPAAAERYLIFRIKDSDKLTIVDAAAGKLLESRSRLRATFILPPTGTSSC